MFRHSVKKIATMSALPKSGRPVRARRKWVSSQGENKAHDGSQTVILSENEACFMIDERAGRIVRHRMSFNTPSLAQQNENLRTGAKHDLTAYLALHRGSTVSPVGDDEDDPGKRDWIWRKERCRRSDRTEPS